MNWRQFDVGKDRSSKINETRNQAASVMLTWLNVTSAPRGRLIAFTAGVTLFVHLLKSCEWAFGATPKVNRLLRPPASRWQADLAVQLSGASESWVFLADDAHGWLELLT